MKNITVAVDDDTYRRARVRAAELGTSVSAIVREHLVKLAADRTEPATEVQAAKKPPQAEPADKRQGYGTSPNIVRAKLNGLFD